MARYGKNASIEGQLSLFPELEEKPAGVQPAAPDPTVVRWGRELPSGLWLGTSSWSFPGWSGRVYARAYSDSRLAREGLAAYGRHPLLRAVGVDRSYYGPVTAEEYAHYASQVPSDFRFLVKAPERVLLPRFSRHPRHGELSGQDNPDFLNAELAIEEWIAPACQGLGSRLGVLLLQFPPLSLGSVGGPSSFAIALHDFLERLPQGPTYAVELRNRELFSASYVQVLERQGACHCLSVHPSMPSVLNQYEALAGQRLVPIRWMLNPHGDGSDAWDYEAAVRRYQPFDRLVDEDLQTRAQILEVWKRALEAGQEILTLVNNKAEGCSPASIERLVEQWLEPEPPF